MSIIYKIKNYLLDFYKGTLEHKILLLGKFFTYCTITTFLFWNSLWQYRFQRIFLVLAFLCAMYYVISSKYVQEYVMIQYKRVFKVLFLFIFFVLLGTLISFFSFQNLPWAHIQSSYVFPVLSISLFVIIIILGIEDKNFHHKIFYPFLILYIPFPFLYLPSKFHNIFFDKTNALIGFSTDAYVYASCVIILSLYFFWQSFIRTQGIKKNICFILFTISLSLLILSASRAALLGVLTGIFISGLIYIFQSTKIEKRLSILIILITGIFFSYIILPTHLIHRKGSLDTKIITPLQNFKPTHEQRPTLWKQSLINIKRNPLGYGPGYNKIINLSEGGYNNFVSHNIFLQATLVGGIQLFFLVFIIFLYFIYFLYFQLFLFQESKKKYIYFSVFIGLFFSVFFSEYLFYPQVWMVSATIILLSHTYKKV